MGVAFEQLTLRRTDSSLVYVSRKGKIMGNKASAGDTPNTVNSSVITRESLTGAADLCDLQWSLFVSDVRASRATLSRSQSLTNTS
jgi:hypothetical protein